MRVLVTGATAPLGEALVAGLLDDPEVEHVIAVGLEPAPPAAAGSRLTRAAVDLTRPREVHDLMYGPARRLGVDTVIHTALHRDARDRGRWVHAQNVGATRELILACEGHPTVTRFVYRSAAEVYAVRTTAPTLLDEDAPLEFDPGAPQWTRDRVEADVTVCARMGLSDLAVVVLRCAEILAAGTGSQLWDYLQTRVCLRPLGFDPMINVLSVADAVAALRRASTVGPAGVYNVPGADTLPLSTLITRWGRIDVPLPGPMLAPLYRLRTWAVGLAFRYDLNLRRFHFGGVVDGRRARERLGYAPAHRLVWPRAAGGGAGGGDQDPARPVIASSS